MMRFVIAGENTQRIRKRRLRLQRLFAIDRLPALRNSASVVRGNKAIELFTVRISRPLQPLYLKRACSD